MKTNEFFDSLNRSTPVTMLLRVQNKRSLAKNIRMIKSPRQRNIKPGNFTDRSSSRNRSPRKFEHIGYDSENSKFRRNEK